MKAVRISQYYVFGARIRYLQDCGTGWQLDVPGGILANLGLIDKELDALALTVSRNTAASKKLKVLRTEFEKCGKGAKITNAQQKLLTEAIRDLRKTLDAELGGLEAYVLTPKRHDTKRLTNDVASLFGREAFAKLPDIAKNDLSEGCKCIAFEIPTAAASRLLRGTEAVLKAFYCKNVKQKRVAPMMWGPMVSHMQSKPRLKALKPLLDHLDNIRVNYRNPTQHPELTYDLNGAENLLGLAIDVVSRMSSEL